MTEKIVTISNHGMVCIPAPLRKKYGLTDGNQVVISDSDEGRITIIPLESMESIRAKSYTLEELKEELQRAKEEEKRLED